MYKRKILGDNTRPKSRSFHKKIFIYGDRKLDKEISEKDLNSSQIPTISTKKFNFDMPKKIKALSNKIKLKNEMNTNKSSFKHCNSITRSNSYLEKSVKKVTFSTVEIIRVENYKKYNASNTFPKHLIEKNIEEMKKTEEDSVCSIF